ncbi:MAG: hypothetical protein HQ536_02340 [Parcubacteria group bacterium]|nr:hypothetical protein [Parcubacteria group bacterium]
MKSWKSEISLFLFVFIFCGCSGLNLRTRHPTTEIVPQRDVERFSVRRGDEAVQLDYYFEDVLHFRYSHYPASSELNRSISTCLWLRLFPLSPSPARPATICVDYNNKLTDITVTAVSSSGNVHRIFYGCDLSFNQEICLSSQEYFDGIVSYYEIERRIEESE